MRRKLLDGYRPGRELSEWSSGEPECCPLVHRVCAYALVKPDREVVPVENRPLESATIAIYRKLRERREERVSDPMASGVRFDEKIFQEHSALGQKCRVVVEEQGEPLWLPVYARNQHLCGRVTAEQRVAKLVFGRYALVSQTFVLSQSFNELEDQRDVAFGRHADGYKFFGH